MDYPAIVVAGPILNVEAIILLLNYIPKNNMWKSKSLVANLFVAVRIVWACIGKVR